MPMRMLPQFATWAVLALASGCTWSYRVQAPYDAFLCYKSSFSECLARAPLQNENTFRANVYARVFAANGVTVLDPGAGTITSSNDSNNYMCNNGTIPYTQTTDQTHQTGVVFVSPTLLNQLGEQMLRLQRIREGCLRTMDAYNFQKQIIAVQDKLSTAQEAVQYLTAKVENANISSLDFVNVQLNSAEMTTWGLAPGSVAATLFQERIQVTQQSELLRDQYKAQAMDKDFKKQFYDAQLAIDVQLREVARELVDLDGAVVNIPSAHITHKYYKDGAWVKQGTVVMNYLAANP